jgi:hypothetical protein
VVVVKSQRREIHTFMVIIEEVRPFGIGKDWYLFTRNRGRTITWHGYVKVKAEGHPRADKIGYVFEHIIVMEKFLGRYLERNEQVHHINVIKTDNEIVNLGRMTRSEHSRMHMLASRKNLIKMVRC